MRRGANKPDIGVSLTIERASLKHPHWGQEALPVAVLFGGMAAFWRLARSHELVITRAAGVSVWQFLLPVIGLAFLLVLFQIGVLNPFAATTISRYERIEAINREGNKSFLALSKSGLWLRQANAEGQ